MYWLKRRNVIFLSVVFAAGCAVSLVAQTGAPAGSLAELTAEIRLLRAVIEQSTRTQTQAQALGIFLSAQQSRIVQVTARLDAAHQQRESVAAQSIMTARELAQMEAVSGRTTNPAERAAIEQRVEELKLQSKTLVAHEQEARTNEADMTQAWQQEEARWNDLIARLQQIAQP